MTAEKIWNKLAFVEFAVTASLNIILKLKIVNDVLIKIVIAEDISIKIFLLAKYLKIVGKMKLAEVFLVLKVRHLEIGFLMPEMIQTGILV